MKNVDLSSLAKAWPSAIVARSEVAKFSGGAIGARRLANLDSQGLGPRGRMRLGRRVCYRVSELIDWLEARAEILD